jgi:hypothetical protein
MQMSHIPVTVPAALLVCAIACIASPRVVTPKDVAAEVARKRCGSDIEESSLAPIFNKEAIVKYEPAYLSARSCGAGSGGCYKRLTGAVITIKAMKGFTAEFLDRVLECHSARRVLGAIAASEIPNDPFWLPGRTVDIDVISTGPEFAATIRSLDVTEAQEILDRAKAFIETGPAR